MERWYGIGASSVMALAVAGCAVSEKPENLEFVARGEGYQAQYRDMPRRNADPGFLQSARFNAAACLPVAGGAGGKGVGVIDSSLAGARLSRNDLVSLHVDQDEIFGGDYVVSRDGALNLPFLDPVRAQGRLVREVEADIASRLVARGFFVDRPQVSVRLADFASVSVGVAGAVFEPQVVEIGGTPGDRIDGRRQSALGASTEGRNLSAALRAAGGVRPDADISAVKVRRGGTVHTLDMRGVFEGQNAVDIMLLTGDEVMVPSRGCFQDDLMRPSPISPPGVSLFLSNLTQPAAGNAISAVGRDVREVPYGTRYMQAVIDTNCVGGARATSADRSAILYSRNPITGVSAVIERDIEALVRRADRDDYDPYVLPGDSIACYDSTITNIGEIGRVLGLLPF